MKILAIETSCDETGVALVEGTKTDTGFSFAVLGHALLSQAKLHAEYGGVYPNLAKREHEKNLPIILEQALTKAGYSPIRANGGIEKIDIDAIAVTQGPGLEPALWTGIEFAKKLATQWQVPLLPTNHMEGHLISSLVADGKLEQTKLPVLALLISGGHTEFVLMKEWFEYEIIGQTLDDAVGEAFDKVARMLGLPYPGGPEISKIANASRAKRSGSNVSDHPLNDLQGGNVAPIAPPSLRLPRPMIATNSCDVSFSGLKTAALYALRDRGGIQTLSAEQISEFAQEFEDAVGDVLAAKTKRALDETGAQTFVIGGGVAANSYLREKLHSTVQKDFPDVDFKLPELHITGDNAIMIADAALARALSGIDDSKIEDFRAVGNLSIAS